MNDNKKTIEKYLDGFRKSDHEQILSCLTDDIIWDMPGAFHLVGKEQFDKEIENPAFIGRPLITTIRIIEENNVVIAEGKVQAKKKEGNLLNIVFCDVFEMENGRIKKLTSYLMEVK